jgi:lysophospholipase L1-like esterase
MRLPLLLAAALSIAPPALADPVPADRPAQITAARQAERRLHNDWAWLGRYRADDRDRLQRVEVVFIGDSITLGWSDKQPEFFREGQVGRGIGGQTTPQLLVRFRQDVIDLHPRAVHIMAGTNDIAGNTGPMTLAETEANLMTMAELARAHGIRVVLASVPPSANLPWHPGIDCVGKIRALNAWLRRYAARTHVVYADYTAVLDDGAGGMKPGVSYDGVHPDEHGYALMRPVAEAAITAALQGEGSRRQ